MNTKKKRVLNVGGNNKTIPLPLYYRDFDHHLLDIDPAGQPDIVADARNLFSIPRASYDAVYCSHNLEHYLLHQASRVLTGFWHIIKPNGFVEIRVPDLLEVMERVVRNSLDLDGILYRLVDGQPILVHDVLYGFGAQMEASGEEFYAHRSGFSESSLQRFMFDHGFPWLVSSRGNLEIRVLAFKTKPSKSLLAELGVSSEVLLGGKKMVDMSSLSARAIRAWDFGEYACAAAMAEIVARFDSKNIDIELLLGEYALQNGNYPLAIDNFNKVLLMDNESLQAHTGILRAHNASEVTGSASEYLDKLTSTYPDIGELLKSLL